jgi:hypothetical protein
MEWVTEYVEGWGSMGVLNPVDNGNYLCITQPSRDKSGCSKLEGDIEYLRYLFKSLCFSQCILTDVSTKKIPQRIYSIVGDLNSSTGVLTLNCKNGVDNQLIRQLSKKHLACLKKIGKYINDNKVRSTYVKEYLKNINVLLELVFEYL